MTKQECMLLAFVAVFAVPVTAQATSNKIMVEAVSDYGGPDDLPNAIPNSRGFRDGMVNGDGTWATELPWWDGSVYPTDFTDPDVGGTGNDSNNFDRPGDAISYFTGHGSCNAAPTNPYQLCGSAADCTNPINDQYYPATCQWAPGLLLPICKYNSPRILYTHADGTYQYVDYSNHRADQATKRVRWGESSNSGNWAGAGTNGGTNLVVLDISCGVVGPYYSALTPAFGGMHLFASIMPITGDTASVADRGPTFAAQWQQNHNGSVGLAWMETLNDLPAGEDSCLGGGGHGINGCGANIIISVDATAQTAYNKVYSESWVGLRNNGNDGTGNSWIQWMYICNFDCQTNWHVLP